MTRWFMLGFCAWVSSVQFYCASAEQELDPKTIAVWVNQLGAEDYNQRFRAEQGLLAAGESALQALEQAQKDPDPHVRATAKELLHILHLRLPFEKLESLLRQAKSMEAQIVATCGDANTSARYRGRMDGSRYLLEQEDCQRKVVVDGAFLWEDLDWGLKQKFVGKYPLKETLQEPHRFEFAPLLERVQTLRRLIEFKQVGEGRLDDAEAYVLEGACNGADKRQGRITMWLLVGWTNTVEKVRVRIPKDGLGLLVEALDKQNHVEMSLKASKIKLDAKFDEGLFVYQPPVGAEVDAGDVRERTPCSKE